jgi:sulfur transfer protein SufE
MSTSLLDVVSRFQQCSDSKQRYQLVLSYADCLPAYPEELKRPENRVLGCSAQVRARRRRAAACTLFAHAGYACMHGLSAVVSR